MFKPNAPGYSFWINSLSDLSRVRAWSGKDNTTSLLLIILAQMVLGIYTILFGAAFRYFFIESEKKFSQAGAIAVIIQGILNVVLLLEAIIILFMFYLFFLLGG